jgi:hypothetical protein
MISSMSTVRFSREPRLEALKGNAIFQGVRVMPAMRGRLRGNRSATQEDPHPSPNEHFVMPLSKGRSLQ